MSVQKAYSGRHFIATVGCLHELPTCASDAMAHRPYGRPWGRDRRPGINIEFVSSVVKELNFTEPESEVYPNSQWA